MIYYRFIAHGHHCARIEVDFLLVTKRPVRDRSAQRANRERERENSIAKPRRSEGDRLTAEES